VLSRILLRLFFSWTPRRRRWETGAETPGPKNRSVDLYLSRLPVGCMVDISTEFQRYLVFCLMGLRTAGPLRVGPSPKKSQTFEFFFFCVLLRVKFQATVVLGNDAWFWKDNPPRDLGRSCTPSLDIYRTHLMNRFSTMSGGLYASYGEAWRRLVVATRRFVFWSTWWGGKGLQYMTFVDLAKNYRC
jgi:hypothetical protein